MVISSKVYKTINFIRNEKLSYLNNRISPELPYIDRANTSYYSITLGYVLGLLLQGKHDSQHNVLSSSVCHRINSYCVRVT